MAPVGNWPYEPALKKEARTLVRVYQGQRCVLGSCRGQSGWEAVAEKKNRSIFLQHFTDVKCITMLGQFQNSN